MTCLYKHALVRFRLSYDSNPDGLDLALATLIVALPFLIEAQAYLVQVVLLVHTPGPVHFADFTLALDFDHGGRSPELP